MEELKVINEVMPVININYEAVKKSLEEMMQKYQNIVVTDETLMGCKATQKELAGLRKDIEEYRLDKKKLMLAPIDAFENQMKSLKALVEKAEDPLKEGIKVFDDKTRAKNRIIAEEFAVNVAIDQELRPEYASRITITDKHCQLSAKSSDVMADLEKQAFALKTEQDMEDQLIGIVTDAVDMENGRLSSKMSADRFLNMLKKGMNHKSVLQEIRMSGNSIYDAEHPTPTLEPIPEPIRETIVLSDNMVEIPIDNFSQATMEVEVPDYFVVYRVRGDFNKMSQVSQCIKSLGLEYTILEQGEI